MTRNFLSLLCSSLLLVSAMVSGCGEDCTDIVCEPSPPVLTVTVTDTIDLGDTVMRLPVIDATVRLFVDVGAELVDPVDVPVQEFDSTWVLVQGQQSGADLFAIVAEREGRIDTLRNLQIQRVEGCCPQILLGWFTIRL